MERADPRDIAILIYLSVNIFKLVSVWRVNKETLVLLFGTSFQCLDLFTEELLDQRLKQVDLRGTLTLHFKPVYFLRLLQRDVHFPSKTAALKMST